MISPRSPSPPPSRLIPEILRRHSSVLLSVALVVTWSSGFVGAELGSRAGADPVTLLAWRFTLLAVLLLAVARWRGMTWPTWGAWRRQVVLGLLCQVAYLFCVFEGVAHGVPGGTAALIASLQPLLVAVVAGSLLGERSSPTGWLGMFLGLVGVVVVVSGDLGVSDAPAWVYLLPTLGMLCLAGGTIWDRRIRPPETVLESIVMQAVVTATVFMTMALASGRATPPASLNFWGAVAELILLASLGGYVLYVVVARRQGATVASTLLYLTPPTTMFWVFVMFGDGVTLTGLAGLVISGAGVWLALRGRRRATPGHDTGQVSGPPPDRPAEPVSGRAADAVSCT